jgi:hypothetical protein
MVKQECSICPSSEGVTKCECGSYYCPIHMSYHKENFCSLNKKRKRKDKEE